MTASDLPAWVTPRRHGPIGRDVASMKLDSPFIGLPFSAQRLLRSSHPPRAVASRQRPQHRLRGEHTEGAWPVVRAGDDMLRAATARGASKEEEQLWGRMSAVVTGELPELTDEWKIVMARQMGMPQHLLRELPPGLNTLDRAKRCAQETPAVIPATGRNVTAEAIRTAPGPGGAPPQRHITTTPVPQSRAGALPLRVRTARAHADVQRQQGIVAWVSGERGRPKSAVATRGAHESAEQYANNFPVPRSPRGSAEAKRKLDREMRIALLSRPSVRHDVRTKIKTDEHGLYTRREAYSAAGVSKLTQTFSTLSFVTVGDPYSDQGKRAHQLARAPGRAWATKELSRESVGEGKMQSVSPNSPRSRLLCALPDDELKRLGLHPDSVRPVVDDETPPFLWPDMLGYMQHDLKWQKNAGKPKPPSDHDQFKSKFFWDRLSKDEQYLHAILSNQAYRGRVKAKNLNEEGRREAQLRAKQIRNMWLRKQHKMERSNEKAEKLRLKVAEAAKREREEQEMLEEIRRRREERMHKELFRITNMVFKALCTDPDTGLPIDPRVIFRRLDTDGGGTVDVDEFRHGLEVCGCDLSEEELLLLWEEIDGADGESDGQVDHEVLIAKLQEVNEARLKLLKPKLVEVLHDQSTSAINKVQLMAEKVQESRFALSGHRLPHTPRSYASVAEVAALPADVDVVEDALEQGLSSTAVSSASTVRAETPCSALKSPASPNSETRKGRQLMQMEDCGPAQQLPFQEGAGQEAALTTGKTPHPVRPHASLHPNPLSAITESH